MFFPQIQHQIINCMSIYGNTIIETGKQLKLYLSSTYLSSPWIGFQTNINNLVFFRYL